MIEAVSRLKHNTIHGKTFAVRGKNGCIICGKTLRIYNLENNAWNKILCRNITGNSE